ncbi:uncharacterized protein LOC125195788 [Salvia hispanica]|uniref:uncharacterized protein LOC125195788 n=1 Tax=Salvia hispanica TaxID=49212 RepID=UPI0020097BD9|nr:uncharacterized protein LOC125195788 [Salvia hispanica]
MVSSRAGSSGGGASDSDGDSDDELDLAMQEAIDRLLQQRQQRRRYLGRSISDGMYPGTTLLHIFERRYEFFRVREDAAGKPGHTPIQKCTATIRQLAYGGPTDMFDEYLHIGEFSAVECLLEFCAGVRSIFGDEYLRCPSPEDCQRLINMHGSVHGFPGMLGSIDCMHWEWRNCPACNGVGPAIGFVANGNQHNMGYYLADGIYLNWPVFVKTIKHAIGPKKSYFATRQEAARKDVERAFGALQSRWAMWTSEDDTGVGPSHGVATANVNMGVPHGEVERLRAFAYMRQRNAHIRLQEDIIEEVWTRKGAR